MSTSTKETNSKAGEKRPLEVQETKDPTKKITKLTLPYPNDNLLLHSPIKNLATKINKKFLDEQLVPTPRGYVVNIETIRRVFADVLNKILLSKLISKCDRTIDTATTLAYKASKICSDVCVCTIYAKQRNLHRYIGTYKGRFRGESYYSKDIELPLPFAIAIENFGLFKTFSMTKHYYYVFPVFPEGNMSEEYLNMFEYESYLPLFDEIGLPTKCMDPNKRNGTAWWTYKPMYNGDSYDLKMPYHISNYSDHSSIVATMFLSHDDDDNDTCVVKPIVTPPCDDSDYGLHFRDIREGEQMRFRGFVPMDMTFI
ncbi:unnamed protein product [Cochlearia groenlandica]